MSILGPLEARSASQRNQAQAAARPARIRFRVTARGPGEHRMVGDDGLYFRAFLLEEPSVTFGMAIAEGHEAASGSAPFGSVCVLEWHINDRGLYTGADVAIIFESCDPGMEVNFSIVFEGYALRATAGVAEIRESIGL